MPNYINIVAPWYSRREEIKKVVIKDGVTNVGPGAFHEFPNIVSAIIGNSVTTIGMNAFADCPSFTSVTMSNSVTSIEGTAFGNSGLTSIVIPNSVTTIEGYAFAYCLGLTSVKMSNSVTSIGEKAFQHCERLTSIEIPNSVTSIGYCAFDGCKSLTSVKIPNSVTSLGNSVFSNCSGLTSVEIPNSVTSIGNDAFFNCSGLTSIEIPNSVTSIEYQAFFNCSGLSSITFKGSTPPKFGDHPFKFIDKSIPIYVPGNSIGAYKNALEGYGLSNIKAIPLSLNYQETYTQDSQIDGADVSFTRKFYGYWEALYLPFSLSYEDWKDDFEVARINAVRQYDTDDDGEIDETVLEFVKMKSGSVIYPNTPYLIKAKEAGEKTIHFENTTLYKAENKSVECSTTTEKFIFTGLYENLSLMQKASGKYYVMDKGLLSQITVQSKIGPYRWRMTRENRDSAYGINNNNTAKEISIRVVGEETTGIANIQHTSPNTQTYDLNGRKVNENNLKPGMYVKNGRKFVVK